MHNILQKCCYYFVGKKWLNYVLENRSRSRHNVEGFFVGVLQLYLKKAGLAIRNIVHLQKILLRCVHFCFYFLHSIREAD